MTKHDLSRFEQETGITFKDKDLLREAFTHRSYLNETKEKGLSHNERLEFLGDAVLELIVTDYLFKKYPSQPEGNLTAYRAGLVNAITLSDVALHLHLGDFLLLSKGESKDIGKARQWILANAIEAVIGAIYLDQGYDVAEQFISSNILPLVDNIVKNGLWQDSKSLFQEQAQDVCGITPSYRVIKESGPDHDKVFKVGVFLENDLIADGEGKSKQDAEQAAAKSALEKTDWKNNK